MTHCLIFKMKGSIPKANRNNYFDGKATAAAKKVYVVIFFTFLVYFFLVHWVST